MTDGRNKLKTDDMYAEFPAANSLARDYFFAGISGSAAMVAVIFLFWGYPIVNSGNAIVDSFTSKVVLYSFILAFILSMINLHKRKKYQKVWRKGEFVIKLRKCVGRDIHVSKTRRFYVRYYLVFDTGIKVKVFKSLYDMTEVGDLFYMVHLGDKYCVFWELYAAASGSEIIPSSCASCKRSLKVEIIK